MKLRHKENLRSGHAAESQGLMSEVANTLAFSWHSFFRVLEHPVFVFVFVFTKEKSEALS